MDIYVQIDYWVTLLYNPESRIEGFGGIINGWKSWATEPFPLYRLENKVSSLSHPPLSSLIGRPRFLFILHKITYPVWYIPCTCRPILRTNICRKTRLKMVYGSAISEWNVNNSRRMGATNHRWTVPYFFFFFSTSFVLPRYRWNQEFFLS